MSFVVVSLDTVTLEIAKSPTHIAEPIALAANYKGKLSQIVAPRIKPTILMMPKSLTASVLQRKTSHGRKSALLDGWISAILISTLPSFQENSALRVDKAHKNTKKRWDTLLRKSTTLMKLEKRSDLSFITIFSMKKHGLSRM